ncbi:hypothetical protein [Flavihumibacter sp. UBA7668]|uniref:hypothetical protein n=1 Tax=Flavihumibacter sp. UBA7668 TaxID=1946542 RepID=UPI0025C0DF3C|nr:hypothetical protein [Flavihumibacter sp. UBA7668]
MAEINAGEYSVSSLESRQMWSLGLGMELHLNGGRICIILIDFIYKDQGITWVVDTDYLIK